MEITTLIPAYRADFLSDALCGLAEQTYKNFKVIISDDSPGQNISKMIRNGAFSEYTKSLHITLIAGPKDEIKNHNNLIRYWAGSSHLAHVHHDDDYIFPNFYEKHVEAHRQNDILLSVSGRWFAKVDGIPCQAPATPKFVSNAQPQFQKLNSSEIIKSLLLNTRNWMGEVTNMVISSKAWKYDPFIPDLTDPYHGLTDVSLVIKCAVAGRIAYTLEKNGVYRIHEQQGTMDTGSKKWIIPRLCWVSYCLQAWKDGHLSESECIIALESALRFCANELKDSKAWIKLQVDLMNSNSNLNCFANIFEAGWNDIKVACMATT
jgi:hypothetical protein